MPKVSVIISTYNRPEKLKKAIESVIAQTYTDWELIVVDDGSNTDDKIMGVYSKDNPDQMKFLSIEHFGNDTKPKNTGIKAARGEYIAFLDDDNQYRPDHLQVLVNTLESNPKVDVAYGDRWLKDLTLKIPQQIGVASDFDMGLLLKHNFIDTSDVLIRKQALLDVGGWDERYKKYVDWNLWIRMAKAGKNFMHVPVIITDYYLHDDMKSVKVQTEKETVSGGNIPEWNPYDLEIELPYLNNKVEDPKVAVYSLTYNRLDYTKKCFESIWKTAEYDFDHYIFDNGSTDGTVEWLKEYQEEHKDRVHIIYSEDNKGISIASNRILDEIYPKGYQIIGKVDNDAYFITPGWLNTMVRIWKSNHRLAMSCYVQGLRDNPGGAPRIGWGWIAREYLGMTRHLGGICHFVDSDAYKIFRWSPRDFLHGVQDLEFSQYLILNGFQMGYMENYFVEHIDGTEKQHEKYPEYFEKRKEEKTKKYGS